MSKDGNAREASAHPAPEAASPASASRAVPRERIPWFYFLAFLVGTAVVVGGIWHYIQNERRSIMAHWRARVSAIADDRARLVESWIGAQRSDAELLAASPLVRDRLTAGAGDQALGRHLDQVARAYGYTGVWVLDARGRRVARSSGAPELAADGRVVASLAAHGPNQIDLVETAPGRYALSISAPVLADTGARGPARPRAAGAPPSEASVILGVVAMQALPEASLFPLLADEEVAAKTAETLLFRVDGTRTAYLSPFRHQPTTAAAVARSLEVLRAHVRSASSNRGVFERVVDYRGVPGLAAIRRIAPTGWGLVFKVDREEALAEFHRRTALAGAAAAFLLLAFAGLLISVWRQQQRRRLLRARLEQERALFNLRGYAEKVAASVPSGLLLLDDELRVLSVNASFLDAFRLQEQDVVGRGLGEVIRTEGLVPRAREVLQTGAAQRDILFELDVETRGERRPVLVTLTSIHRAAENAPRLLLIVQDLTEEERLRAARQASERRLRELIEGLDAIVWEADAATLRFSFVSQRAEEILGWPLDRWLAEPGFFAARIHPEDRARATATCREAIRRAVDHELEYRAVAGDGREIWLRDIVHVLRDPGGRAAQLRGLTVDISEQKRAQEALRQTEEQLRQAQKMDAVGKLAGGIAHDFNNLLMVIQGDSDLILRRLPEGDPLRANAEGIRQAAGQATALTGKLLAFSRKQVLAPTVLDINRVVTGVHTMLERLIGETIELVTITAPDLGWVKADAGQIEQLLLNLAVNARDAMPDGGRLTIETGNLELDAAEAARRGVEAGAYVALDVSDTGVGLDADVKAHLFEPFFTTKDHGKGTGLGLSTVYGIVEQSGGFVTVESEPGKGAAFRVLLPRVAGVFAGAAPGGTRAATPPEASPATAPASPRGPRRETILLVEDSERVRDVVREILDMHGYEVVEASHGAEALAASARHPGPIHLMVTDVVMPEMSGRELAQRLSPLRPEMKVLYMSGYTDDAIVRHGVLDAGMAFLSKPFSPDALAGKVRELLDSPRAAYVDAAGRSSIEGGLGGPLRAPPKQTTRGNRGGESHAALSPPHPVT